VWGFLFKEKQKKGLVLSVVLTIPYTDMMDGTKRGIRSMDIGAHYLGRDKCRFIVWAPLARRIELKLSGQRDRYVDLSRDAYGYWHLTADGIAPGSRYLYRVDEGQERPDPASFYQPDGVHQPSAVVDHTAFKWGDSGWQGIEPQRMIIYELHVGTFSPAGTFEGAAEYLDELQELGVNTIEIMPVAQFPGQHNWGYDGVYLFAPQNSYGGPDGLKRLVDAAHRRGMAVLLDVVYNHFGPEGNYTAVFGPYTTPHYKTLWGDAVNFDNSWSYGVRDFFIANTLYWLDRFHFDGLRLDAVQGIEDMSAVHFLQELRDHVTNWSRSVSSWPRYLIAESDLNDSRVIRPAEQGGYGIDAQWSDDFHHPLHTVLTGEERGYYSDFVSFDDMRKAFARGVVYEGRFSWFRKRRHGNSFTGCRPDQFVVFSQNHDQIGNRMLGERLSSLLTFEAGKLAAGAVILSPYIPLLFMGEEYAETAPFLYFIDHGDRDLVEAIRVGRKAEFESFQWDGEPIDPQSRETFERCRLRREKKREGNHARMYDYYRALIRLRVNHPGLGAAKDYSDFTVEKENNSRCLRCYRSGGKVIIFLNFERHLMEVRLSVASWRVLLDSSDPQWGGPGGGRVDGDCAVISGSSVLVLERLEKGEL
jgi:maltooligosyltrehalose trehalohydrolase